MRRYQGRTLFEGVVDYFRVVDESGRSADDRAQRWIALAPGGLRLHDVPSSSHLDILKEPWVDGIASALREVADTAQDPARV
jgi:hypothetical protein